VLTSIPQSSPILYRRGNGQDGEQSSSTSQSGFINCCFSFTIRRDTWGIPSVIVGRSYFRLHNNLLSPLQEILLCISIECTTISRLSQQATGTYRAGSHARMLYMFGTPACAVFISYYIEQGFYFLLPQHILRLLPLCVLLLPDISLVNHLG
jgi:hypothetical protein